MDAAIVCQGLVKRYGEVTALDGLDLVVPSGSVFGVLGPNGAGKTTAVRLLTGLAEPTAGQASVAGYDVRSGGNALRQRISYLDQQPHFYDWMRGRELLEFVGELFGLRGQALRSRVDEVLEIVDLTDAARRKIGGYSGGMRQRLGVAQALINEPEVLFLDEPVSALDPAGRHDLLRIIESLRGRATVFMSTHILADVERVCDRVAIINRGRLIVESTVPELQARYAQPAFILEPELGQAEAVNRLAARLEQQSWAASVNREAGEIRVVARDPEAATREILPVVAASGVALVRYERGRPSLEDIFLRLVGEHSESGGEREVA